MVTNGIQEPKINRVHALISNAVRLTGIGHAELRRMPSKVCSKCGEEKDFDEFSKQNGCKDGLYPSCKKCCAEKSRKWNLENKDYAKTMKHERYIKNRDSVLKKQKEYTDRNKEKIAARNKIWRLKNKDYIKDKGLRYYSENKEVIAKKLSEYQKSPAGKLSIAKVQHRRRVLERESECTLTLEQWDKIVLNQDGKCAMCGKKFCKSRPPEKDHIIPVSKGGGLTYENVQALCRSCNSSKCNKIDYSNVVSWGIYS